MSMLPALITTAALALTALSAQAAGGAQPVKPLPRPAAPPKTAVQEHTSSLPAQGLFKGDQLTPLAKQKLSELILDALGLQVDVALLVPTGPWKIDGEGPDESRLTPARLAAVKRFLTERGVDAKHIYVESHIDGKIKEPRLDVHIVGKPAID
jgi:OOP family OmpA-OmpF porin